MKTILLLAACCLTAYTYAQLPQVTCYPSSAQTATDILFVGYEKSSYKYTIPDLSLQISKSYNQFICGPASFIDNTLTFAASQMNTNSTTLSVIDLSITGQSPNPAPFNTPFAVDCITVNDSEFCFGNANNVSSITRRTGGNIVETLQLPIADTQAYLIYADPVVTGRIHVATHTCQYRGCSILQYYALSTSPSLSIARGPIALPHTVSSGCPVEPTGCGVDVLLSGTFNIKNDIVTYAWSISEDGEFKVTIVAYDARCDVLNSVRIGSTLQPIARCAAATPAPSEETAAPRNCWTCPANFVHWYDIEGMAEPEDPCACVPTPTPAPCWTCPANFVHWYDIEGMEQPADRCACVPNPSVPPSEYCWTCPAGYKHWYEIEGWPEPEDKCACFIPPTPAPCWTCPAGYIHWYDVEGMAEPEDRCACVPQQRRLNNIVKKFM